jgi:geranylgeranyl pyrophosphate synthase
VIDNKINSEKNAIGSEQLPLLASFLPCSSEPGLDTALLAPVREFASRDSKQVRAQLVRLGFALAHTTDETLIACQQPVLDCLACVVEALHAGSLMIDDIQDADEMRRGKAALHMQIGVPRTINAANWLYFWPADLLRQQALAPAIELEIYRVFHKTMMRAHQGQALDLGHDMTQCSQREAFDISVTAIELKTGELTGMCAELGAIVGEADSTRRSSLTRFGQRFGVALQMFNDIGDVSPKKENHTMRKALIRPSWVWAVAAKELETAEFTRFQYLMADPKQISGDDSLLFKRVVVKASDLAVVEFEGCLEELNCIIETNAHVAAISSLRALAQKVMTAYA